MQSFSYITAEDIHSLEHPLKQLLFYVSFVAGVL